MSAEVFDEQKERKLDDIKKESEEKKCAVQRALYFIQEFLSGPMCGRCFPCALGTGEAMIRLTRISRHTDDLSEKDIEAFQRIGAQMIVGSLCKKGKDTGRFIVDILTTSNDEFKEHLYGVCSNKECISLAEYVINPELCTMCGKCAEVCRYSAIMGEKRKPYLTGYLPYEIRQKRCTQCGECVKVCPTGAIEVVSAAKVELAYK